MNNRRKLVIALGMGALSSPFTLHAQPQTKVWRIGFLALRGRPASLDADSFGAFPRGMREFGYVEGKNLEIQWRHAEGKFERLAGLAAELVRLKVDVIVVAGNAATSAAQKATATIPIVCATMSDPVGSGFVASLARPGGNITGLSNIADDISPKHLEMLLSMAPKLLRVAVLVNPANSGNRIILKSIQTVARSTRAIILPVEARTAPEIEIAFSAMARENVEAVIVAADSLFTQQVRQIADLSVKHRLLSISTRREFAEAGALISYGPSFADMYRHVAIYADKILKGAKPADLPVEQPTKFELFINGKTAKMLSLKIPQSLLISADKVIN
jgi:putative ABC transport system substrate-binding protein